MAAAQSIRSEVLRAISRAELPCFIYDAAAARQRAGMAASLVRRYFFPVKACPEPGIVRAVLSTGCGLDLCSSGDVEIASAAGCPGHLWKFSSVCGGDALLRRLCAAGATLDADSLEQALEWRRCGGTACGLRIAPRRPRALYGSKFGVGASEVAEAVRQMEAGGVRLAGLHLHDQHTHLSPQEFGLRLAETLLEIPGDVLRRCEYVNIGGSWPMRFGNPATAEALRAVLDSLRQRLAAQGFRGAIDAEPGRWVVEPCGFWAARVVVLKSHPAGAAHRVVVLDTSTPIPCRPPPPAFEVARDGALVEGPRTVTCDLYGSANTALDSLGTGIALPALAVGDVLVATGQGAYTRQLIPPFNERERPGAIVLAPDEPADAAPLASQTPEHSLEGRAPGVFVFNPLAEGHIAHGGAFAPVKHQALLAADLEGLPQFLCDPGDIVLVANRPSEDFLATLERAGFAPPEFIELAAGRIAPGGGLLDRKLGSLNPWAWGPDSVSLLKPLFAQLPPGARNAGQSFNDDIARLYSKAWSAEFLRKALAQCREDWLCGEPEAGVVVETVPDALEAIAAIRARGHHRVIIKEALGVAGHNAIRLWEPEILPEQRRWLEHHAGTGSHLVVEPWLERELDFSIQLEMGPGGLELRGYTGLVNDLKGQFLANWAEPGYSHSPPAKVAALPGTADSFERVYAKIFSLLEIELRRAGFLGPISIDALIYRTPHGERRLKPIVEINPRHTMGRVAVELMSHACPGCHGLLRLVTPGIARKEGAAGLAAYAAGLAARRPLRLEAGSRPRIRQGALCLNDPARARACLATFEAGPALELPGAIAGDEHPARP